MQSLSSFLIRSPRWRLTLVYPRQQIANSNCNPSQQPQSRPSHVPGHDGTAAQHGQQEVAVLRADRLGLGPKNPRPSRSGYPSQTQACRGRRGRGAAHEAAESAGPEGPPGGCESGPRRRATPRGDPSADAPHSCRRTQSAPRWAGGRAGSGAVRGRVSCPPSPPRRHPTAAAPARIAGAQSKSARSAGIPDPSQCALNA